MAVAISEVAEVITTSNTDTITAGAFTPTANSILVALVSGKATVVAPTMSDSEGSWTLKGSAYAWPSGDDSHRTAVFWRKVGGSPISITPAAVFSGDDFSAAGLFIFEVIPDTVVSGDPIRQVAFNATPISAVADPNVTFLSALQTANGYVAHIMTGTQSSTAITAPSGWTETGEQGVSAPGTGSWGGFRAGGETGTTITATMAAAIWVMVAVEIYNSEPAVGGTAGMLVNSIPLKTLVGGGLVR